MSAAEFNFDGLVGPTHNYGGLAHGNLASQENRHLLSHPRQAALQGLAKMKFLADLGVPQGVLPPQRRPHMSALRQLGFTGTDARVLERAARDAPHLLAACYSASAMWAANAATVSPSADTADGRVHFTPANLASHFHRALEAPATHLVLRKIFPGPHFVHHDPLPGTLQTTDEGAANHSRLCVDLGERGVELFVYGNDSSGATAGRFAARQMRTASEAIARLHALDPAHTLFLRQHPDAIAAGVFHNDVIAVAHRHILLRHEFAFAEGIDPLVDMFQATTGRPPLDICVPASLLPIQEAVRSYFFNSQLVALPGGSFAFIAPAECGEIPQAAAAVEFLRERLPGLVVYFINVRESMRNGGGPACLRLRVVLSADEQSDIHAGALLTDSLYTRLYAWVEKYYRETLAPADLADPTLREESEAALDALAALGVPVCPE